MPFRQSSAQIRQYDPMPLLQPVQLSPPRLQGGHDIFSVSLASGLGGVEIRGQPTKSGVTLRPVSFMSNVIMRTEAPRQGRLTRKTPLMHSSFLTAICICVLLLNPLPGYKSSPSVNKPRTVSIASSFFYSRVPWKCLITAQSRKRNNLSLSRSPAFRLYGKGG